MALGVFELIMTNINFYFLSFLLLGIYSRPALSQDFPRWQVDISSGLFITEQSDISLNELGRYDIDLAAFETKKNGGVGDFFYINDLFLSVSGQYKINSFFAASGSFSHTAFVSSGSWSETNSTLSGSVNQKIVIRTQRLNANLKLDALYKNNYEELNLIAGLGYNILYARTSVSNTDGEDSNDALLASGNTRTMRQLRYFNLNLGLEWRDYFSEHFGYFISFYYNPTVRTNTHSLLFEQVSIEGETHPLEGQKIKPGENGYPEENFEFNFMSLSFGLTFQW